MPASSSAKTRSLYSVHPGLVMVQKWEAELRDKTGRSLDEWIALLKKEGPADQKGRREWLKQKHKLGTNSAWRIADRAAGKGGEESSPESYLKAAVQFVDEQYSGAKSKMRPIYEALLKLGVSIGNDVLACPCKTIVPLYRNHVFAQIKPTTNTRIDFGFALAKHKGKLPKRLVDTGGLAKKDRITHRIEVKSIADIDSELKSWLQIAYDFDA